MASPRLATPITFNPAIQAQRRAVSMGAITWVKPWASAARAAYSPPEQARTPPPRSSSPRQRVCSNSDAETSPRLPATVRAKAKSRRPPALGRVAGAKLINSSPAGKNTPPCARAAGKRARVSRRTLSGKPVRMIRVPPRPSATKRASTVTRLARPASRHAPFPRITFTTARTNSRAQGFTCWRENLERLRRRFSLPSQGTALRFRGRPRGNS